MASKQPNEQHHFWKGDKATAKRGRGRAREWFALHPVCAECEAAPAVERHHWDGNPLNNAVTNVVCLCRRCHMRIDGRLDALQTVGQISITRKRLATHCKRGHPLFGENLLIRVNGSRRCRTCARERQAQWKSRRAAVGN